MSGLCGGVALWSLGSCPGLAAKPFFAGQKETGVCTIATPDSHAWPISQASDGFCVDLPGWSGPSDRIGASGSSSP